MILAQDGKPIKIKRPNPLSNRSVKKWDAKNIRYENWHNFARRFTENGLFVELKPSKKENTTEPPKERFNEPLPDVEHEFESNIVKPALVTPLEQAKPLENNIGFVDGMTLYCYIQEDVVGYDSLYGESRTSKLREKPIVINVIDWEDDWYKFSMDNFKGAGVKPTQGSILMQPNTHLKYIVTDVVIGDSQCLMQIVQEGNTKNLGATYIDSQT